MSCTDAQILANRENAQHSTGPVTDAGKERSRRNAVKHGLASDGTALPDELEGPMKDRLKAWTRFIRPASVFEERLVHDLALASIQIDAAYRYEQNLVRINGARDTQLWHDNMLLRAAELGEKLAARPDRIVCELWRFSCGCTWMAERWSALRTGLAGAACSWTDAQVQRVLDLMGIPADERESNPDALALAGLVEKARAGDPDALRALRADIDQRLDRLDQVADRLEQGNETVEYQALKSGQRFDSSRPVERIRRLAQAAQRKYDRALDQLAALRPNLFRAPAATAPGLPSLGSAAPSPADRTGIPASRPDFFFRVQSLEDVFPTLPERLGSSPLSNPLHDAKLGAANDDEDQDEDEDDDQDLDDLKDLDAGSRLASVLEQARAMNLLPPTRSPAAPNP